MLWTDVLLKNLTSDIKGLAEKYIYNTADITKRFIISPPLFTTTIIKNGKYE
jgi:hypothetical protein